MKRTRLWIYFNAFEDGCLLQRWRRSMNRKNIEKIHHRKLKLAFQAWILFMQARAQKKMLKLQDYAAMVANENQKARSECERLAQILETGEWGRQQLADLLQARDVLSEERDALLKLVHHLQQQQSLSLEQRRKTDEEIRLLKDRMFGNDFISRNKLLVKGASSFNSVVKALKTDAHKKGVEMDLLHSVSRISMDEVSIFPDGELNVKALHPLQKGKWVTRQSCSATSPIHFKVISEETCPHKHSSSPSQIQQGLGSTRIVIEPIDNSVDMLNTKISVGG